MIQKDLGTKIKGLIFFYMNAPKANVKSEVIVLQGDIVQILKKSLKEISLTKKWIPNLLKIKTDSKFA